MARTRKDREEGPDEWGFNWSSILFLIAFGVMFLLLLFCSGKMYYVP